MNIFLIQDDLEVARVAVEENGKFKVEDVDEGVYAVVAAGKDGFAALSVELVQRKKADGQSRVSKGGYHYVSHVANENRATSLGIAIVTDPDDLKTIRNEVTRVSNMRRRMANQPRQRAGVENGAYQGPGSIPNNAFPQNVNPSSFGGPGLPANSFPVSSFPSGFSSAPVSGGSPAFTGPGPRGFAPTGRPPSGRLLVGALLLGLGIDELSDDDPPSGSPAGIQ